MLLDLADWHSISRDNRISIIMARKAALTISLHVLTVPNQLTAIHCVFIFITHFLCPLFLFLICYQVSVSIGFLMLILMNCSNDFPIEDNHIPIFEFICIYCIITTLGSVTHHDWPQIEHQKHFVTCHNWPWPPTYSRLGVLLGLLPRLG